MDTKQNIALFDQPDEKFTSCQTKSIYLLKMKWENLIRMK